MNVPDGAQVLATLAGGLPVILPTSLSGEAQPDGLVWRLEGLLDGFDMGGLSHLPTVEALIFTETYSEPLGPSRYVRLTPDDREQLRWVAVGDSLYLPFIGRQGEPTNLLSVVMSHSGTDWWEVNDAWFGGPSQPPPAVLPVGSTVRRTAEDFWRTFAQYDNPELLAQGVPDVGDCPYDWHCPPPEPSSPLWVSP